MTTEPRLAAWCCELSCENDATVSIFDPTMRYDLAETHACADHFEALGGGVEGNIVTPLASDPDIADPLLTLLKQLNPEAYLDTCDRYSSPGETIYAVYSPDDGGELGHGPTEAAAAFDAVRSMVADLQRDNDEVREALRKLKAALKAIGEL